MDHDSDPSRPGLGERDRERADPKLSWRETLHEIIFEADTPFGKGFDLALIVVIILSVIVVVLDSVEAVRAEYGWILVAAEWFFTGLFTIEYLLRLGCVGRPARYAFSFFGIIDLLAIVPTYLSHLLPGSQYLVVIRVLRVLRIFRVLKLAHHLREANILVRALRASCRKIVVFVYAVLTIVVIVASLMYLIEGEEHGFENIPVSIYWTIVTLTTVGFGDITPQTGLGQTLAAIVMLVGYAIIAVPTGIVTAELTQASMKRQVSTQVCKDCSREGHDPDAIHCKFCGARL